MKKRKYPFKAYTLTPAMLVKSVELVSEGWHSGLHETLERRSYLERELYDTPEAAIAAGRAKLDEQRNKLAKQQAAIDKRAANLTRAENKL